MFSLKQGDLISVFFFTISKINNFHFTELVDHKRTRHSMNRSWSPPGGAYLILQLHDELIYEVCRKDVHKVSQIIKREMEQAIKLSVKLPVKLKCGQTWGTLQDVEV